MPMTSPRIAFWLLAAFVASIPSENAITLPGIGSLSRLIGLAAFAATALSLFRDGRFSIRPPSLFTVLALLFVAWNAVTYFWSVEQGATVSNLVTLTQLFVVVWLMWQLCRSETDSDVLVQAFVLGCYVTIAVALVSFFQGSGDYYRSTGGFNPNSFAIVCALGIPMTWLLSLQGRARPLQWLNTLYPVFAIAGIVLSASRGGLITGLVALTVLPASMVHMSFLRRILSFALIASATWSAFVYGPQLFPQLERNIERLSSASEEITEGTLTGRTTIWAVAVDLFAESPVGGVGSGAFAYAAEPFLGKLRDPHNVFLAVASETGLVGLVLYTLMLVAVLLSVLRLAGLRRIAFLILFASLLVGMLPSNAENDKFAWFILALLAVQRPLVIVADAWAGRPAAQGSGRLQATGSVD